MSLGATDRERSLFLKGFKLSKQGNYEDPTYLGFKIVFDFGTLPISPEDGMPPSPLFRDRSYFFESGGSFAASNPFSQPQYDYRNPSEGGMVQFYSASSYLEQREFDFQYGPKRADMLRQFKSTLDNILSNSPWFFQSINGLDTLAKVTRSGYQPEASEGSVFNPQRTASKTLEITTLESLNLRISALADLYNQATFDYDNMRELLPRNLRRFTMYIFVSEIRNFFKTSRLIGSSAALTTIDNISTLLASGNNPGSNLGTATSIAGEQNQDFSSGSSSTNPGSSFNSFVGNIANQSGLDSDFSLLQNQQDQSGIKPMIVFECKNCEFDFTESTPIPNELNIGTSATPVTNKFKIHVGKVRMRTQYPNIRQDGKPLVLGDSWDAARSSVQRNPGSIDGALSIGGELLTNFVSNSLNDLVNEGVANLAGNLGGLNKLVMGNAYSFNPSEILGSLSFNSAQNFINGLDGVNAGIKETTLPNPQTTGFGGPPERVYNKPSGDAYEKVPGADLGVTERVYNKPSGDAYNNVPGQDLGSPERVYVEPEGDAYNNVPGQDLGSPERVYPSPEGDAYNDVPGSDLGSPDRVYPSPEGDVYATVPGADLGSPDRVYPAPGGDVYANVPGKDLGVPDRIYPDFDDDVYSNVPGTDLGVPERVYGNGLSEDVYTDLAVPQELENNNNVYPADPVQSSGLSESKVYPDPVSSSQENLGGPVYQEEVMVSSRGELRSSSNTFDSVPTPVYTPIKTSENLKFRGDAGKVYPSVTDDFKIDSPVDLGNLKPPTKYNVSLGQFNPDPTDYD